jgi:flavin reductase (DIM6/NTAB) family NADH-FMN oxidoreductase RutF
VTFGKAGRSQCRACRRRRSPHKIKAGKTKTGENAQRKAVGDIAATDFPNARRAHALLSCRFSRQSLEVGDHVKLLRRVTERYVRHECARDRVRWICDPGAQIVVRPG